MDKTVSKSSTKAERPTQACRRPWWTWLAILLLPIIFWVPLWGEMIQVALIGYEGFCCLPDNWQELEQKAEQARSMRLGSNLILGASVILAILILAGMIFILYKYAIPCIVAKWLRRLVQILVGVIIAPLALVLLLTLILLVFHNDEFHKTRYQPPRDYIYAYTIDLITPSPY